MKHYQSKILFIISIILMNNASQVFLSDQQNLNININDWKITLTQYNLKQGRSLRLYGYTYDISSNLAYRFENKTPQILHKFNISDFSFKSLYQMYNYDEIFIASSTGTGEIIIKEYNLSTGAVEEKTLLVNIY